LVTLVPVGALSGTRFLSVRESTENEFLILRIEKGHIQVCFQRAQWDYVVSRLWRICCMQPDLFLNRDSITYQCAHWYCQEKLLFPYRDSIT
jgi:hypothetical protein